MCRVYSTHYTLTMCILNTEIESKFTDMSSVQTTKSNFTATSPSHTFKIAFYLPSRPENYSKKHSSPAHCTATVDASYYLQNHRDIIRYNPCQDTNYFAGCRTGTWTLYTLYTMTRVHVHRIHDTRGHCFVFSTDKDGEYSHVCLQS